MAKQIASEDSQGVVIKAAPIVYPFRVNGTDRVYEVDAAHVATMMSRSDLTYIGTVPLPKGKKDETQI